MATVLASDTSDLHGAAVVDEILLIPTSDIDTGDRLRAVDDVWAAALGDLMTRDGQHTPVQVCRLPGSSRWTIVVGAHRHRGAQLAEIEYLRAEVVSANRVDRRLREVNENLWRRDLDPLDRAAFVAELVELKRAQAGIGVADHRAASVPNSKKAIDAEAGRTLETISNVYGWSEEVGEQLGFTGRTVRNDLLLYRRLAPSLIGKLRAARHPILGNATQLRALAKLDDAKQARAVAMLLDADQPAKTLGDAVKMIEGRRAPDAETKRLSTFIGTFQRMGIAEKRGALAHLGSLLPASHGLVADPASIAAGIETAFAVIVALIDGEGADDEQLADAAGKLQFAIDALKAEERGQ